MATDPQIASDLALIADLLAGQSASVQRLYGLVDALMQAQTRRNFPVAERDELHSGFWEHLWDANWRRLRQWRGEAPLSHYLAALFRNFQNDAMRALESRQRVEDILATDPTLTASPLNEPERVHEALQLAECLEHGKSAITARQRQVIDLRHTEQLPYSEIAIRMAVQIGTVGRNLADAETALRRRLQGECKELLEDVIGAGVRVH